VEGLELDITTIASIATILSFFVSVFAILISLKVRQDYTKFKIEIQGTIGSMTTVYGNPVNFIMTQNNFGNAILSQTQTQADEAKNSVTVASTE
jgi:hypothetical protein